MPKCKNCKTGAHVRSYRSRVAPGTWQEMYECKNCGARWKKGKRYKEQVTRKRTKIGGKPNGKKATAKGQKREIQEAQEEPKEEAQTPEVS